MSSTFFFHVWLWPMCEEWPPIWILEHRTAAKSPSWISKVWTLTHFSRMSTSEKTMKKWPLDLSLRRGAPEGPWRRGFITSEDAFAFKVQPGALSSSVIETFFFSHHMCWSSLVGACYTIQHVGCWELICDLYQSFVHQLWVGYTSAACGASVKVSTGIVCFPSHIPPLCWRTHDASLITLEGPFLPPWHSSLFPFLTLGRKLHHVLYMQSSLRVARTNLVLSIRPAFLGLVSVCLHHIWFVQSCTVHVFPSVSSCVCKCWHINLVHTHLEYTLGVLWSAFSFHTHLEQHL